MDDDSIGLRVRAAPGGSARILVVSEQGRIEDRSTLRGYGSGEKKQGKEPREYKGSKCSASNYLEKATGAGIRWKWKGYSGRSRNRDV